MSDQPTYVHIQKHDVKYKYSIQTMLKFCHLLRSHLLRMTMFPDTLDIAVMNYRSGHCPRYLNLELTVRRITTTLPYMSSDYKHSSQ